MEKKKIIFYIAIAMTLIACGVFGGGGENSPGDNVADVPNKGGDTSSGNSGAGDTESSEDSGNSRVPGVPGATSLDLSDPSLYVFAPNYTSNVIVVFDGFMVDGSPLTQTIEIDNAVQSQPPLGSQMTLTTDLSNQEQDMVIEAAIIGDQTYTFTTGVGCFVIPTDSSTDLMEDLFTVDGLFIGQANRVETGVQVNGFMTDRYEITPDNINPDHESFETDFSLTEGSLFITREGGFPTRILLDGTTPVTDYEGFDPSKEAMATFTLDYIPVEGTIDITPPAACADQISEGGDFPLMDDAAKLSSLPGITFYESSHTLEEVLEFYRTEMAAAGWTLTDDNAIGSFASLTFTKEGQTVNVLPVQNGPTVAVSIVEE